MLTTGFVAAIQIAFSRPFSRARNISTAVRPAVGECSAGLLPGGLQLAAMFGVLDEAVARQLVRQQPRLAAAHRVGLAGQRERPGPGLPICPVSRCRLMRLLFFHMPTVLWFSPMQ